MIKVTNKPTNDSIYIERIKRGDYVAHYGKLAYNYKSIKVASLYLNIASINHCNTPLTELKELASGLYYFDFELSKSELLNQKGLSQLTRDWLKLLSGRDIFKNGMDTKLQEIFITNDTKELLQLI